MKSDYWKFAYWCAGISRFSAIAFGAQLPFFRKQTVGHGLTSRDGAEFGRPGSIDPAKLRTDPAG